MVEMNFFDGEHTYLKCQTGPEPLLSTLCVCVCVCVCLAANCIKMALGRWLSLNIIVGSVLGRSVMSQLGSAECMYMYVYTYCTSSGWSNIGRVDTPTESLGILFYMGVNGLILLTGRSFFSRVHTHAHAHSEVSSNREGVASWVSEGTELHVFPT